MSKKMQYVQLFILVGLTVLVFAAPSFAYGEQIESNLNNLLNWITKVLGGIAVGFGVVFTGFKVSLGDEHALKNGLKIVGGGIIIFSAMNIVALLQAVFR